MSVTDGADGKPGLLDGFDWKAGVLDGDGIELIQSLYLTHGCDQDSVASMLGTTRWMVRQCLVRSQGSWIPDPARERQRLLNCMAERDEAHRNNALLQDENRELTGQIHELRDALNDAETRIGDLEFARDSELADAQGAKDSLMQELELQKRIISELRQNISGFTDQVRELRDELSDAHSTIRAVAAARSRCRG
jgi:predicted transcriptional regulator